MKNHYRETRQTMTPQKALQYLKEGNERFINNLQKNRDLLQLVNETAEQQFPFAAILSCSDSRTSTELVFDQGLGDVFSIRLAGNIASVNAIASMEYACKYLGTKLIVVLGHTGCGAISAACAGGAKGNIAELLSYIQPAVDAEKLSGLSVDQEQFKKNVTHLNVSQQLRNILDLSPDLRGMIERKEVGITGGLYDLQTGKVTFYEDTELFDVERLTHQLLQNYHARENG